MTENKNTDTKSSNIATASAASADSARNVFSDKSSASVSKTQTAQIKQNAEKIIEQASKKAPAPAAIKAAPAKTTAKKAPAKKAASSIKDRAAKNATSIKDNVVDLNKNKAKEAYSTAKNEVKRVQDKAVAITNKSADYVTRSADISAKFMNEAGIAAQENLEACMEASQISADHANRIGESIMSYANESISRNVDLSKELFACRTASDVFELQSRFMQNNMDRFFNQTAKLSEMMFTASSKSAEPISERMAEAAQRMQKVLA